MPQKEIFQHTVQGVTEWLAGRRSLRVNLYYWVLGQRAMHGVAQAQMHYCMCHFAHSFSSFESPFKN